MCVFLVPFFIRIDYVGKKKVLQCLLRILMEEGYEEGTKKRHWS